MPTSQTDITLFEPAGVEPIDLSTRLYFGGLARHAAHEFLLEAFEHSGLSKAELASRLGYDPARLGRILNTPANITMETFGEVLFAMDGSCPHFSQRWPLRDEKRNYEGPDWLAATPGISGGVVSISVLGGYGKSTAAGSLSSSTAQLSVTESA